MQKLKPYFLYYRIIINPWNRQIQTNATLFARKKGNSKNLTDPGLRNFKVIHQEDTEYLQNLEHEQDLESGEMNFMQADAAYDEHLQEKKYKKERLQQIITAKKFFKQPQQPLMLTYSEKQNIRYLHQQDPIQWDVKTLSESFPATPIVIKKILQANWKVSPERQKKMDQQVQKNWELLAEGKLDADPEVIKHFKKFLNRRTVLVDQTKNKNFYLPEIKEEHVWNNGEMNSILAHYEKSIQELEIKHCEVINNRKLTDGIEPEKYLPLNNTKEQNSLEVLHKKINKENAVRNLEKKESFILGKMIKTYQNEITFEELQDSILKKAENEKELDLHEKVILDSTVEKLKIYENNSTLINESQTKNVIQISTEEKLPVEIKNQKMKKIVFTGKELNNEHSDININGNGDDDIKVKIGFNKKEKKKLRNKFFDLMQKTNGISLPDEKTCLVNEGDIGKMLNFDQNQESNLIKKEQQEKEKKKSDKELTLESELRAQLFYEKQEQDIKNTAFWNNARNSKDKALAELEKPIPVTPKEYNKVTRADVSTIYDYPEKINIPKSKQGTGLTFKVKDCYYDDDGEFLYRVPGMTK